MVIPNIEKFLYLFSFLHYDTAWMTEPLLNRPKKYKWVQFFQI